MMTPPIPRKVANELNASSIFSIRPPVTPSVRFSSLNDIYDIGTKINIPTMPDFITRPQPMFISLS
jgi:hypothetical protein